VLTSQIPVILGGYDAQRQSFVNVIKAAAGKAPVACWLPHRNDTTTSVDPISGRVWTADATMAGQISPLGKGSARLFNGTSNYLTTPDTTDMSFGNSTTDSAFSIFCVVNVTDTAAARDIITKLNTVLPAREWAFTVTTTDAIQMAVTDESVPVNAIRNSDAGIIQGSWTSLSSTYSAATGGATAANDMTHYNNGAVIASTATNQATYVAMENTVTAVYISNRNAGAGTFWFSGSIALILVLQANLSAAQHLALHNASRSYFQF
jgi:hypothetical protein